MQMSLSGLHAHVLAHVSARSGRVRSSAGTTIMRSWYRGDEVFAQAVVYIRCSFPGRIFDVNRVALAACQDLITMRVASVYDSCGNRSFGKRSSCLIYIHRRARSVAVRPCSGTSFC